MSSNWMAQAFDTVMADGAVLGPRARNIQLNQGE